MKLKYLIYTITLTGLTACGDFLEPKSQSQYIPKDANALQEMLIGEPIPNKRIQNFSTIRKYSQMMSKAESGGRLRIPRNDKADMERYLRY